MNLVELALNQTSNVMVITIINTINTIIIDTALTENVKILPMKRKVVSTSNVSMFNGEKKNIKKKSTHKQNRIVVNE